MPRPDATPAFVAAIQSANVKPALFVQINFTTGPVYVWSGSGSLAWNGNTWVGVGSFGAISTVEEGSDVQARGIVLTLSGIDPTLLGDVLNDYEQGLPAVVYLGLFDASNSLIANPIVSWSGRTDQPTITMSGETATLSIACENRLVEMNTDGSFFRYTQEIQSIFYPQDTAFSRVNAIQQQTLYWGRTPDGQNLGVSSSSG